MIKKLIIVTFLTTVNAQSMPDWREDGSTQACGQGKLSDKPKPGTKFGQAGSLQLIPFSIYAKPGDTKPRIVITERLITVSAVEKKGIWLKVVGSGNEDSPYKVGEFLGYVRESDLMWVPLRHCN